MDSSDPRSDTTVCRDLTASEESEPASVHGTGEASKLSRHGWYPRGCGSAGRKDVEYPYELWDRLSDFGAQSLDQALRYCMKQICAWIGAQNAFWLGTMRVAQGEPAVLHSRFDWQMGPVVSLNQVSTNRRRIRQSREVFVSDDPGQTNLAMLAEVGQFRVRSLGTGLVDFDDFRQTPHYDYFYRESAISDRIWVVFPIDGDSESCFCFDKYSGSGCFTEQELIIAGEALRGVKWFHRQILRSHGVGVRVSRLTPAEHRALHELLSGDSEKVIAERLGWTPATAHQYVKGLYRKFGVRRRAELMSLWLKGRL